jgi:hypothetical protein
MAATEQAFQLTNNYRQQQSTVTENAVAILAALWRTISPAQLSATYPSFLAPAVRALTVAQQISGGLSAGYLPAFIGAETGTVPAAPAVDVAARAGVTVDGRPLEQAVGRGLVQIKMALATGRPIEPAMNTGLAFVVRTARTEVPQAGRDILSEAMNQTHQVHGWVRVTSARPCGACLADAGHFHIRHAPLPVHSACQCTAEPVVRNLPDRFPRPTGQQIFDRMTPAEQDALFAGRGGADKAELIRSGATPLADLATVQETHNSGRWITETPLAALV